MDILQQTCVATNCSRSEFICDQRGGDHWLVRKNVLDDMYLAIDEEINAVKLYKTASAIPFATFSCSSAPLRAVFCGISTSSATLSQSTENSSNELAVAILTVNHSLHICLISGEQFEFMVPFGVQHLISTPFGLLLEKRTTSVIGGEAEVTSFDYYCLKSVYEPLSPVEFQEGENRKTVDKSYQIIRAYGELLCMMSKPMNRLSLVLVAEKKKEDLISMDNSQLANLSVMSGMMFVDRSSVSEASSRSLERFRSENSSRLSNSSGDGVLGRTQSSGGRIINVGAMTRQKSLPRSSPSPTNMRNGRASSPFMETVSGNSGPQYANSNTLHSLLGVQQFTGAVTRFRDNSMPAVGRNNSAMESRATFPRSVSRSPKASYADNEDEKEDDLLNFDFLTEVKEERDVIMAESTMEFCWIHSIEITESDDIQVQFAAAFHDSQDTVYLYVAKDQLVLYIYRISPLSSTKHNVSSYCTELLHQFDNEFHIGSIGIANVTHNANPSIPIVILCGSTGMHFAPVGSTLFQPLNLTGSLKEKPSPSNITDDDHWIDSLVLGYNPHQKRSAEIDDGEESEDQLITSLASLSPFIVLLTAEPSRKIYKFELQSSHSLKDATTIIAQELITKWKQLLLANTQQMNSINYTSRDDWIAWLHSILLHATNIPVATFLLFILLSCDMVPITPLTMNSIPAELAPLFSYARRLLQKGKSNNDTNVQNEDLHGLMYEGIKSTLTDYLMEGHNQSTAKALHLICGISQLHQQQNVLSTIFPIFDEQGKSNSFYDLFTTTISSHSLRNSRFEREARGSKEPPHLALLSMHDGDVHNIGLRFLHLLQSRHSRFRHRESDSAMDEAHTVFGHVANEVSDNDEETQFNRPAGLLQVFLEAVFIVYDRELIDVVLWKKILLSLSPVFQHLLQLIKSECQEDVDPTWPPAVLAWIGRNDLYANAIGMGLPASSTTLTTTAATLNPASATATGNKATTGKDDSDAARADDDGLYSLEASSLLRFPEDNRMREVCRMLRSSKPLYLKVDRTAEVSDIDFRGKQLERLGVLLRRSFACPVGRGMLTIATSEPLMAEKLPIPILSIQGRVPPLNTMISADNIGDNLIWPAFHNGVAAALRVGPKMQETLRQSQQQDNPSEEMHQRLQSIRSVTRNWIMYNKTAAYANNDINAHAGILLGLGLFGHLNALTITDICDYLTQGQETTTIAVLIGVSISKMATADALVSKTLFLHLPSLIPIPHWGMEISPVIQSSALIGIGFLFARSCNRLMIQFLLEELFRKSTADRCECRESLSLSAAWALAMIVLPRLTTHRVTAQNADIAAGDFLRTPGNTLPHQHSSASSSGIVSIHGELADMRLEDRLCHLIAGGKRPADLSLIATNAASGMTGAADPNAKSSRILEGDMINTDVTSPGATLALGLLYQRSQNEKILRRLEYPSTVVELDSIRPDHLLYRSLARTLIQWDAVEPSLAWFESQLPPVLLASRKEHLSHLQKSSLQAHNDKKENENDENNASKKPPAKKYSGPYGAVRRNYSKLDSKVTLTLLIHCYAGFAQGLGLVYAGTFDERVKKLLLDRLQWLQSIRENKTKENFCTDKLAKYAVDTAACATCLALSCVMAGSGDLDCLRVFRALRWRTDPDQTYGFHMAYGMAIGMLFLGGGKFSLKRDPVSIACLLLANLPRYPNRSIDQQSHLQALRHLYVLAVEPRVLQTIDVDSGVPVSVDLEVELTDGRTVTAQAPGLLPELQSIHRIAVKSPQQASAASKSLTDFYPCAMDLQFFMGQHDVNHNRHKNPNQKQQKHQRQLSSPHSPWRVWAAAQQAFTEMSMMQHCTMLPPLFVKRKPSDAIVLPAGTSIDLQGSGKQQEEDESSESTYNSGYDNASNKQSLSFLLNHIFSTTENDDRSVTCVSTLTPSSIESAEVVEKFQSEAHRALLKQLWQFPNVQQTLLKALSK